jgi:hypothetical protein
MLSAIAVALPFQTTSIRQAAASCVVGHKDRVIE